MIRRKFIQQSGFGIIALSAASSLFFLDKKENPLSILTCADFDVLDSHFLIYDRRFEESTAIAQETGDSNLQTFVIEGDITEVWYQKLRPYWNNGRQPISGLTTAATLFLLSQMAKDQGKQVVAQQYINDQLILWKIA